MPLEIRAPGRVADQTRPCRPLRSRRRPGRRAAPLAGAAARAAAEAASRPSRECTKDAGIHGRPRSDRKAKRSTRPRSTTNRPSLRRLRRSFRRSTRPRATPRRSPSGSVSHSADSTASAARRRLRTAPGRPGPTAQPAPAIRSPSSRSIAGQRSSCAALGPGRARQGRPDQPVDREPGRRHPPVSGVNGAMPARQAAACSAPLSSPRPRQGSTARTCVGPRSARCGPARTTPASRPAPVPASASAPRPRDRSCSASSISWPASLRASRSLRRRARRRSGRARPASSCSKPCPHAVGLAGRPLRSADRHGPAPRPGAAAGVGGLVDQPLPLTVDIADLELAGLAQLGSSLSTTPRARDGVLDPDP